MKKYIFLLLSCLGFQSCSDEFGDLSYVMRSNNYVSSYKCIKNKSSQDFEWIQVTLYDTFYLFNKNGTFEENGVETYYKSNYSISCDNNIIYVDSSRIFEVTSYTNNTIVIRRDFGNYYEYHKLTRNG